MTTTNIVIEPAQESDLSAILNLLKESGLPQEGLSQHLSTTLVARADQDLIGSAALELYETVALLRSVAVAQPYQGQGTGQRLMRAVVSLARQRDLTHLYLLTETSSEYFSKFNFRHVDRSEVPLAVQQSVEFTSLCPASALAMELSLERIAADN